MILDALKRQERRTRMRTIADDGRLPIDADSRWSDCVDCVEAWVRDLIDESTVPVVVVLEGGHFDPMSGADLFSQNSLRCSLAIGRELIRRHGRSVRVVYGVLVDDLGLDCNGTVCRVGPVQNGQFEQALPSELEEILRRDRFVKRERLIVSTERHSRNRSLKQLKRLLDEQPDLLAAVLTVEERDGSTSYLMQAEDGLSVQVATRVETRWTVKCPLIMASHYSELVDAVTDRFGLAYTVAVVDFSEVSDRGKVNRGSELAVRALIAPEPEAGRRSILNVFWGDDFGEIFFTDSFHDSELQQCCSSQSR